MLFLDFVMATKIHVNLWRTVLLDGNAVFLVWGWWRSVGRWSRVHVGRRLSVDGVWNVDGQRELWWTIGRVERGFTALSIVGAGCHYGKDGRSHQCK